MKAKILVDDAMDRFKAGEVGEVLKNDYNKYDFCIDLGSLEVPIEFPFGDGFRTVRRIVYFYKDEIELMQEH